MSKALGVLYSKRVVVSSAAYSTTLFMHTHKSVVSKSFLNTLISRVATLPDETNFKENRSKDKIPRYPPIEVLIVIDLVFNR